ncbi:hypothetical protein GOQ27_06915 [Clostridium sp. D2Q-11]|uniref:Uncharacterized protein n=1 Tax=Anaeromonas frigoriresistens TaxID=2683708 RepID=A0A942V1A5_9FIRM|nr:hypothetical protein [Anaeromonas frigoriresistens]MBS4538187.1 hypothetical protein [Anaeromonas frigoriresistens]
MNISFGAIADQMSLDTAVQYHEKLNIDTIITDGKDVTFEIEEEPTSLPAK